jgi:hypothetical protein
VDTTQARLVGEITENNMADIGTLSADQLAQQQQISRQQKMAEMLLQSGMQQPQSQMVSGHYVAPSWTQGLANLASVYMGQKGLEKAEQAQLDLARKLRENETSAMADFMQQKQGRPAVEGGIYGPDGKPTTQTTADMFGADMELNPQYREVAPVAGVAPNPQAAYANLYANPKASAAQRQFAFAKMNADPESFTLTEGASRFERQPDGTIKQVAAGAKKPIQIDTGTHIEFRDSADLSKVLSRIPKSLSPKDAAELADKGIIGVGGGMPMGGMSMGGGMPMGGGQAKQVVGDARFMPSTLPTYEYDPTLSPQQNREAQGKFSEDLRKNVKNAKESFDTLKSASQILSSGLPSSGRLESMATGVKEFFGSESEQAKQDSKLTILDQKLTGQVPRFEGPQSNVDVAMYQAAAGDLGNSNKTIGSRLAAAQTLIDLNKKYYPNGNWESIDLSGPVTTKQTLLKGEQRFDPVTFRQGLNPEDQAAFDWIRKNPNDPRSSQIKKNLGIK